MTVSILLYLAPLFLTATNLPLTEAVKYSITTRSGEIIPHNKHVIESEEGAKRLTIDDNFPVFGKDLLRIYEKTAIFIMNRNDELHKIEEGAFEGQEITKTIVITNTQVTVIPKGAFKDLKIFELVLKDNRIQRIEEEAFADLPNLEIVNLSRNKIVALHGNSFVGAPVKYVDLAFNRLSVVEEFSFRFMSDEEPTTVLLDNNEIDFIDSKAFDGVLLGTLNLRSNQLENLPSEIFEGDSLTRIYSQDNKLESLPQAFFALTQLNLADFSGNPLECDDKKKLKKLAKETRARILFDEEC